MSTILCFLALFCGSNPATEANMNFARSSLASPDTCDHPFLLDSAGAKLRWPFPSGSWTNRNFWLGANEPGGIGSGWGQGLHKGSDYYAVDWNKVSPEDDCDSAFYSPLGGTVIFVRDYCGHFACFPDGPCAGNEVIIQSNVDTSYAFGVLHLNNVNAHVGKIVNPGDYIGSIGATGLALGSHAHCFLYRNIGRSLTGINFGSPFPDNHATPFNFSAECGGVGPNNIILNPVTSIPEIEFNQYFRAFPNPVTDVMTIAPKTSVNNRYTACLYAADGKKMQERSFSGNGLINLASYPAGTYFLVIAYGKKLLTKRILLGH